MLNKIAVIGGGNIGGVVVQEVVSRRLARNVALVDVKDPEFAREKEILILSEKMTNKEVGNRLFIAEKTVKSHITNINKKLNVTTRIDAIAKAKELALVDVTPQSKT